MRIYWYLNLSCPTGTNLIYYPSYIYSWDINTVAKAPNFCFFFFFWKRGQNFFNFIVDIADTRLNYFFVLNKKVGHQ